MTETALYYTAADDHAWLSTDERRWINWAKEMSEKYPDDVKIRSEDKDGTIVVELPIKWFKLSPPRKMNLTDEQKRERAEILRLSREKMGQTGGSNT